jgi:hypothetical protein
VSIRYHVRMTRFAKRVLWLDSSAAAIAGLLMFALRDWLTVLYALPASLLLVMSIVNVCYAAYSGTLAFRALRGARVSARWISLLVMANAGWSVVCVGLAIRYRATASMFGLGQLLLEAAFVRALAWCEWTYVRPSA